MKYGMYIFALSAMVTSCTSGLNEGISRLAFSKHDNDKNIKYSSLFISPSTNSSEIDSSDNFQINLISAYICNFRESSYSLSPVSKTNNNSSACRGVSKSDIGRRGKIQGEIAILAGFKTRSETGSSSDIPDQRLIYYNDDVRASGQLLNFINIPIFGPAQFSFAASRLKVTILEMDKQDNSTNKQVLGRIAKIGASVASPAQNASLRLLEQVGSALIDGNGDDRELEFNVGFDAPAGESGSEIPRLSLREGYFAVIRREDRSSQSHFDGLKICPHIGVIMKGNCKTGEYYSDASWLLLRVSKEDSKIAKASITRRITDIAIKQIEPTSPELLSSLAEVLKKKK